MRIHLLHINDVHSQLENYMRAGADIRRLRQALQAQGEPVFTFDIGDVVDRVRPETEATHGLVNAAMLGALECDGWVFGNNEGLTIPLTFWPDLVRESQTTVFGTNVRDSGGHPLPFFSDWHVFEQAGVRIGVFGLTPFYEKPYEQLNVQILPPFPRAEMAVQALREEGVDVVVALSHLGLREDRRLAAAVSGIDVILGGHTHNLMESAERVGQTWIHQAGWRALAFGHTVVELSADRAVSGVSSRLVRCNLHGQPDAAMLAACERYTPRILETLANPVVCLEEPLKTSYDCESVLANVLVDALLSACPCDFGMIMSGALTASLLPGQVCMEHVHAACLTPTRPLLMTMNGADVREILTQSVQSDYWGRLGYGYGFRGSVIGWMALANVRASLERLPAGGRVRLRNVCIGGEPLDDDRPYRLVTCEYLWLSPAFEAFHKGRDVDIRPLLVRDLFRDRLRHSSFLKEARQPRYVVFDEPGLPKDPDYP